MVHFRKEDIKEQSKPEASRIKEIIKKRTVINEIEKQKMIEKINKRKKWFFEKINKIDQPLTRMIE